MLADSAKCCSKLLPLQAGHVCVRGCGTQSMPRHTMLPISFWFCASKFYPASPTLGPRRCANAEGSPFSPIAYTTGMSMTACLSQHLTVWLCVSGWIPRHDHLMSLTHPIGCAPRHTLPKDRLQYGPTIKASLNSSPSSWLSGSSPH